MVRILTMLRSIASTLYACLVPWHLHDGCIYTILLHGTRAALDERGIEEAERLGQHWAELLKEHAAAGRIQVVVSPMQRCMQTADPLMRHLAQYGQVSGTVNADLHETHGLLHPVRLKTPHRQRAVAGSCRRRRCHDVDGVCGVHGGWMHRVVSIAGCHSFARL